MFCSLHGLIRGENMELGRDSDTGGQVILDPLSLILSNVSQVMNLSIYISSHGYLGFRF